MTVEQFAVVQEGVEAGVADDLAVGDPFLYTFSGQLVGRVNASGSEDLSHGVQGELLFS